MATIPPHLLGQLNLSPQTTVDQLMVALEGNNYDFPLAILSSPQARASLEDALNSYDNYELEQLPCTIDPSTYTSVEITLPKGQAVTLACFPGDLASSTLIPPTNIESKLLTRWVLDPNLNIFDWHSDQAGKAIVIWDQSIPIAPGERAVADVFTTAIAEASVERRFSPLLSASTIRVLNLSRFESDPFSSNILAEALKENNPKWRFLGLYRVIENGYLFSILNNINRLFYSDPKNTIAHAAEALKNEVGQLIEHATQSQLEGEFDNFETCFQQLLVQGSIFATGIHVQSGKAIGQHIAKEQWKRGLIHCYKIRCAIAHAGGSGTYIERFSDWRPGVERLLPVLEKLALGSLKVSAQ